MGRMANSWRGSLTAAGLFEFAVLAVLPNCHGFCHDPHPNQICARDLEGICCQAQNEYLQAGRKWLAENQKQSVHTGRRSARTADAEEVIILAPRTLKLLFFAAQVGSRSRLRSNPQMHSTLPVPLLLIPLVPNQAQSLS